MVWRNSSWTGVDAAFALHGFEQDGGGFRPDRRAQGFGVVERQVAEAGQQRIEALVDLGLGGGRHRPERPAVERLREGQHLEARRAVGLRPLRGRSAARS